MFRSCTFCLIAGLGLSYAVNAQDWQDGLRRIETVAGSYCGKGVSQACEAMGYSGRLADGLRGDWARSDQRGKPLPKEYVENLNSLATQLETLAQRAKEDDASARQLTDGFAFVARDLRAKYSDCMQFGMGRLVSVNIRTVRGDNAPDPGWEVFYRCTLSNGQAGGEVQARGLTAIGVQLPPAAVCVFRARRGTQEAVTGQIPVFGREPVDVEVKVP